MSTEQQISVDTKKDGVVSKEGNLLFPVFMKLETLQVLLVGGGKVGTEKLTAILDNAPATPVTVVALQIADAIRDLAVRHPQVVLVERAFTVTDLDNKDLAFIAVNDIDVSH